MKWADYRERLGLGFDDKSKFEALKNRFCNFTSNFGLPIEKMLLMYLLNPHRYGFRMS